MLLIPDGDFICHNVGQTTFSPMWKNNVPDTEEVDVVYKFLKAIKKYCLEYDADNVAFCWDSRQSKRKRIFPGYKIRGPEDPTPEEIRRKKSIKAQMKVLRTEVLPAIGFTNIFHQIGHEGDDVMASVVFGNQDDDCLMITADKDMLQLLSMTDMYSPSSKIYYTEEVFQNEYGIRPSQWMSVKQIGGCTSDKVPGVEGVAEGRAIAFITGKMKETSVFYNRILDADELIARNAKLVNLPFEGTEQFPIEPNDFDMQDFMEVCTEYGFVSFINELEDWEELLYDQLA